MPKISIIFGLFLIILGVISYACWQQLGAAKQSITALIPAFVGILLILFGGLSLAKPTMRMHFMHGAVTIALLGALAALGRFIDVIVTRHKFSIGAAASLIMTLICGLFVALCVRSFIAARRERNSQASA